MDIIGNTEITEDCSIEDKVKFVRKWRQYWRDRVQYIGSGRLDKLVMKGKPESRRPPRDGAGFRHPMKNNEQAMLHKNWRQF